MDTHIEIVKHEDLADADAATLAALMWELFGEAATEFEWMFPEWHIILRDGSVLASHVGLLERVVQVRGADVTVMGVGNVMTPPAYQGKGLASKGMDAAAALMRERGVPFGFLFCGEHLVKYYDRLGWQLLNDPVTFHQSDGPHLWHACTMVLPVGDTKWPRGPVDLGGPPF